MLYGDKGNQWSDCPYLICKEKIVTGQPSAELLQKICQVLLDSIER